MKDKEQVPRHRRRILGKEEGIQRIGSGVKGMGRGQWSRVRKQGSKGLERVPRQRKGAPGIGRKPKGWNEGLRVKKRV